MPQPPTPQERRRMSISTIRRYTEEDQTRVQAAAIRFCERHGLGYDADSAAELSIDHALYDHHDRARLLKLWTACYCRALQVPCDVRITTGYGYIGRRCQ
jgi:hypothetical protein